MAIDFDRAQCEVGDGNILASGSVQGGLTPYGHYQTSTILENINLQISQHQKQIDRLNEAKNNLEKAGLINIRIEDLSIAMQRIY